VYGESVTADEAHREPSERETVKGAFVGEMKKSTLMIIRHLSLVLGIILISALQWVRDELPKGQEASHWLPLADRALYISEIALAITLVGAPLVMAVCDILVLAGEQSHRVSRAWSAEQSAERPKSAEDR
jgi:hypothetical protein